jgi:hypothetical protein
MWRWKSSALCLLSLVLIVVAGACTSDDLDDGDSAGVVLQVLSLEPQAVTAQAQQGSGVCSLSGGQCTVASDCPLAGEACTGTTGCQLTVEEWDASLQALPKNSVAITSPFNDVVMNNIVIDYTWQIAGPGVVTQTIGLNGVTVPVNGQANVTFFPISAAAVSTDPAIEGNTADLIMRFNGVTVEGRGVSVVTQGQLNVESCP